MEIFIFVIIMSFYMKKTYYSDLKNYCIQYLVTTSWNIVLCYQMYLHNKSCETLPL